VPGGVGPEWRGERTFHGALERASGERVFVDFTQANQADHYGIRLRGSVTAPITGDYTFFVAGDDNVALWLSSDASRFNKRRIAWHSGYTSVRQWDRYTSQRSQVIHLLAGETYYIEAQMIDDGGADHLAIGWAYEAPVSLQESAIGLDVTQSWTEADGVYGLDVEAGDIWDSADRCAYLQRSWTGDGEFVARIPSMNNPYLWAKVGLILRSSLEANSAQAMVLRSGSQGMAFQRRLTTGASSRHSGNARNFPWVKLHRKGDAISAYISEDAENWIFLGKDVLTDLPETVYVGIAATDNSGSNHLTATVDHLSLSPLTAVEVIPSAQLTTLIPDANDADDDNLPDDWQAAYPITGSNWDRSEYGDPDADFIPNLEESQLGTDPTIPSGRPGSWLHETWKNISAYDVAELVHNDRFFSSPDTSTLSSGSFYSAAWWQGARRRAYLTAPDSGDYTFWVSGRGGVELWLSTDDSKYAKQRIAVMGAEAGTGHGVSSSSAAVWDTFASQMSNPVHLEAGQTYFIEVLSQNGHVVDRVSLAWARPGQPRQSLDTTFITSYAKESADSDDDYLPDDWEAQYGLSISDNGLIDREREGENGDFDSDGLNNRAEYLAGTDPTNSDTDGDGISDAAELRGYGTDPLTSDAPTETIASTIDLTTFTSSDYNWSLVDGGLLSDTFRGAITWNFNVPTSGTWILQADTRLRGRVFANELVHVNASIDGRFIGRYALSYGASHKGILRMISPGLSAGNHSLTLMIDNLIGRRMVQIDSLTLRAPSGLDANGDGIPDWVEAQLAGADYVKGHATTSRTSPVCLEGHARIRQEMRLNNQPVLSGADSTHWYANFPLQENTVTSYTASFANGQQSTGEIFWQATNILDAESLTIRKGDSLQLAAWNATGTGSATIASATTGDTFTYSVAGNASHSHTFTTAGTHTVTATHSDGTSGTLTVNVLQATMPDDTNIVQNAVSFFSLDESQASRTLYFEAGAGLDLGSLESVDASTYKFRLYPRSGGQLGVLARLWKGGPILDVADINAVTLTDALQNGLTSTFVSPDFSGYYVVKSTMVVLGLPEGGSVKITIFRNGVTFLDGTKIKTFDASYFDNGILHLEFLFPIGMSGGYCHSIDIYDAQGRKIGSR